MSSINAPFGLRPAFHPSGTIRPVAGTITTLYNANIFMGSPVGILADGSIALSPAAGVAATGAVGAFQGVEYNMTATGPRVVSNMWPANMAAVAIVAYYTLDPTIVYEIQCSGTLTQAAIGGQYNWSVNDTTAGNTITGLSNVTLNVGAAVPAGAGLRVIGLTPGPDNAWGDAFPVVQVQLAQHQFVAGIAAI